jgi:hypothetical protein
MHPRREEVMIKEKLIRVLATLLKVYIERGIVIPELERDLKDGAVKEIRHLISNPPTPTVTREQVEKAVMKYRLFSKDPKRVPHIFFASDIPALLADLGIGVEEKKS